MSGTPFTNGQFAHVLGHVSRALADSLEEVDVIPARLMRGLNQDGESFQRELQTSVTLAIQQFYDGWSNKDHLVLNLSGGIADDLVFDMHGPSLSPRKLKQILLDVVRETRDGWSVAWWQAISACVPDIELPQVRLLMGKDESAENEPYPMLTELHNQVYANLPKKLLPLDLRAWAEMHRWYKELGVQDRLPKQWKKSNQIIVFPGTVLEHEGSQFMPVTECVGSVISWRLKPLTEIANPNITVFAYLKT